MGTNYYWEVAGNPCPTCKHDPDVKRYHIGKSSHGWTFSFHAESELRVETFRDWLRVLKAGGGRIVDEYGTEHTLLSFVKWVLKKRRRYPDGRMPLKHAEYVREKYAGTWAVNESYLDPEGHSFSTGEWS